MAQVLGTALAGLAKKEVAEKLASGFKDMKDTVQSGKLAETFQIMNEFGVNIQPLMAPISLITSQIAAGTTPAVIDAMKELMELVQQPSTQIVIDGIIYVFTLIIQNATNTIALINKITDALEQSPKWTKFVEDLVVAWGVLMGWIQQAKQWIDDNITPIVSGTSTPNEQKDDYLWAGAAGIIYGWGQDAGWW